MRTSIHFFINLFLCTQFAGYLKQTLYYSGKERGTIINMILKRTELMQHVQSATQRVFLYVCVCACGRLVCLQEPIRRRIIGQPDTRGELKLSIRFVQRLNIIYVSLAPVMARQYVQHTHSHEYLCVCTIYISETVRQTDRRKQLAEVFFQLPLLLLQQSPTASARLGQLVSCNT